MDENIRDTFELEENSQETEKNEFSEAEKKVPATMEEDFNPEGARKVKWSNFIETTVADFFIEYKLEKLSLEDGNGNKAKFSRTKDNAIKVEYASTTLL